MAEIYCTYRDNEFNGYMGRRVRVNVKNRKKRSFVFVGILKAFDFHLNVVLADVSRVMIYCQEEQAKVIDGLMLIRGIHVRNINLEDRNILLQPWPTRPVTSRSQRAKKSKAIKTLEEEDEDEKKDSSILSTSINPSKPLKLKRTWLTAPTSPNPTKAQTCSQEGPGSSAEQMKVSVNLENPDDIDDTPVKVKEEIPDYEEGESLLKSFKDFLVTSDGPSDFENGSSD